MKIEKVLKFVSLLAMTIFGAVAFAQDAAATGGSNFGAIGKGLALGLGALGTGVAQSAIGAAALGAVVEDRRNIGFAFIFFLLPETLVIFGFVGFFLIK
ncbi:MAG: F0F1 ATP synthase subunit C [Thermaceae bacterium]|nr:F0F1 ATP synthase subunit C [Thermaceae bacterium]